MNRSPIAQLLLLGIFTASGTTNAAIHCSLIKVLEAEISHAPEPADEVSAIFGERITPTIDQTRAPVEVTSLRPFTAEQVDKAYTQFENIFERARSKVDGTHDSTLIGGVKGAESAEIQELNRELINRSSILLESRGVKHRIVYNSHSKRWAIEIEPDKDGPLVNRQAFALKNKKRGKYLYPGAHGNGVTTLFDPIFQASGTAGAAIDTDFDTLLIPLESAIRPNKPNLSFRHEFRHAKTSFRDLVLRKESPFYGYAKALEGEIDRIGGYDNFVGFDEMNTHLADSDLGITRLRAAIQTRDANQIVSKAKFVFNKSMRGKSISYESAAMMLEAYNQAKNGKIQIEYTPEMDQANAITAKFELNYLRPDGARLKVALKIPLVKSQGVADPRNLQLLLQQLASTYNISAKLNQEFSSMSEGMQLVMEHPLEVEL